MRKSDRPARRRTSSPISPRISLAIHPKYEEEKITYTGDVAELVPLSLFDSVAVALVVAVLTLVFAPLGTVAVGVGVPIPVSVPEVGLVEASDTRDEFPVDAVNPDAVLDWECEAVPSELVTPMRLLDRLRVVTLAGIPALSDMNMVVLPLSLELVVSWTLLTARGLIGTPCKYTAASSSAAPILYRSGRMTYRDLQTQILHTYQCSTDIWGIASIPDALLKVVECRLVVTETLEVRSGTACLGGSRTCDGAGWNDALRGDRDSTAWEQGEENEGHEGVALHADHTWA
jgi:hypothetical protein